MAQNILRLVADFKKKLNTDKSTDNTLAGFNKTLQVARGCDNTPVVKDMLARINAYKTGDDAWEKFKAEQIDSFLKGLELQSEMHAAAVEAGFMPKSRINSAVKTMLITITPPPHTNFAEFEGKCLSYLKRAFFIKYYAAFEQTGELTSEIGKGFHIHIVAEVKYIKSKILQDTKSSFAGMVGSAGIDIKLLHNATDWDNALAYISGSKLENPNKAEAAALNPIWRKSRKLRDAYSKDISLPNKPGVGKEIDIKTEID